MDERGEIIVGAMRGCASRESLEDVFARFGVTGVLERVDWLNQCMGNPQTFFVPGEVSLDEVYELTIQMFLSMSWKLNKFYDLIGAGNS